jgi:hypothetical protein
MLSLELTNEELYVLERDVDNIRSSLEREFVKLLKSFDLDKLTNEQVEIIVTYKDNIIKSHSTYVSLTRKLEELRRSKDE